MVARTRLSATLYVHCLSCLNISDLNRNNCIDFPAKVCKLFLLLLYAFSWQLRN